MVLFRRFRDAAVCIALLAIPFFFLNASLKAPEHSGALDRALLGISAPVQYVAAQVARGVGGVVENYVLLVDLKTDRDRLREEVTRLRLENAELRAQAGENLRLRELLDLRDRVRSPGLAAQVVGKEVSRYFRVIRVRVDRGTEDNLREGMPVVSAAGLVGQLRRVAGNYSDVLLAVDASSRIDVVVQRTGARGILRGTGDPDRYACRIEYLEGVEPIQVGDEVYTSGFGPPWPEGVRVGRVARVVRRQLGRSQDVEVSPAADFSRLDAVLILDVPGRAEEGTAREDGPGGGAW